MHLALVLFFIVLAPVIAGVYGAIYDMIVFTFAPEFFTVYRFPSYDISEHMNPIIGAAIIGFANAWKVGIPVGIVLGALSYMHRNIQKTFRYMMWSYTIVVVSAVVASSIALVSMRNQLSENVYIGTDEKLKSTVEIIMNMNNFAYSGALIGTVIACAWQLFIIIKKNQRKISA
jgi:hypothetical protein